MLSYTSNNLSQEVEFTSTTVKEVKEKDKKALAVHFSVHLKFPKQACGSQNEVRNPVEILRYLYLMFPILQIKSTQVTACFRDDRLTLIRISTNSPGSAG